jgi:hypothetical protein
MAFFIFSVCIMLMYTAAAWYIHPALYLFSVAMALVAIEDIISRGNND